MCVRVCAAHPPDEVPTVGAVGGLSQVGGHELVSVDLMHSAADGALSPARTDPLAEDSLLIVVRPRGCRKRQTCKHLRFYWHSG